MKKFKIFSIPLVGVVLFAAVAFVPRARTGAGEIQGTLIDSVSGQPVKGARITAMRYMSQMGPSHSTETDANGKYAIEGLPEDWYTLLVRMPNDLASKRTFEGSGTVHLAGPVQRNLELVKGVTVSGTVRLTNGKPAAGVSVQVGDNQPVDTDSNGHYAVCVPPGFWQVNAMRNNGHYWLQMDPAQAVPVLDPSQHRLDITVWKEGDPVTTFTGKVLNAEGRPNLNAEVLIRPNNSAFTSSVRVENGEFKAIFHGSPKFATVTVHGDDEALAGNMKLLRGKSTLIQLQKGRTASLSGKVVDSSGNPIREQVSAYSTSGMREASVADRNGCYTFKSLPVDARYWVVAPRVFRSDELGQRKPAALQAGSDNVYPTIRMP